MTDHLTPPGAELDVVAQIEGDHRTIRALLSQISATSPDGRASLFPDLLHSIAVHEVAEERVFPAVRGVDPDLEPVLAARLDEQTEIEELLVRLEQLDAASEEFAADLARLESAVLAHTSAEEEQVLPVIVRLDEVLGRVTLGARYDAVKRRAPTRPHPHAPHTPPGDLVADPFVSFVDHLRDHLR